MGVSEKQSTREPGLYGGIILLFSATNGELLAILNDGFIQHLRVAGYLRTGCQVHGATRCTNPRNDRIRDAMAKLNAEAYCLVRSTKSNQGFQHPTEPSEPICARNERKTANRSDPRRFSRKPPRVAIDILAAMTDSIDPVIYAELLEQGMCLCTVTNAEMSQSAYRPVDRMVLARTSTSDHHFTTPEKTASLDIEEVVTRKFLESESVIPKDRVHQLSNVMLERAPGRGQTVKSSSFNQRGWGHSLPLSRPKSTKQRAKEA